MRYILFVLLFCIAQLSNAVEANREATVLEVLSLAADRPNAPASQNLVRIYINSASWGAAVCREDAVDLKKEDAHLLSTLLFAIASQKTITIGVDDRRKPYDNVCQVVWLRFKS